MASIHSFVENLKGDKTIWAIITLLAIFSFLPVYSASSNLVYVYGRGNTFSYLLKHLSHLIVGFCFVFFIHRFPYLRFRIASKFLLVLMIPLLVYTLLQGTTIGGANASRWLNIFGMSFQPSTSAFLILMIYVSRHLAKYYGKEINFQQSLLRLWTPVLIVVMLVLPANFSTAALIFLMVLVLVFISGYPIKYLAQVVGIGAGALTLFIVLAITFPDAMPNRVQTWKSRIENFTNSDESAANEDENYQVEKAKMAIATGGLTGLGPGKSLQKNFLPQSSSDFIFAIIVEEYGLVMACILVFLYLLLLFRFIIQAGKSPTIFGRLLILGLGLPIIAQALINMCVAVNLLPVTGQTLPLISSGGTSIWMTCIALGVILSVTNREEVLPMVESEGDDSSENDTYSIEDIQTPDPKVNPLTAVQNQP